MYKKHKIALVIISCLSGGLVCLLGLHIVSIASEIINVVAISSALYLAAYAGIQASPVLRENLKKTDIVNKDRSQRYILNSYIKAALLFNILTIIFGCSSMLVADKIAQSSSSISVIEEFQTWLSGDVAVGKPYLRPWEIVYNILNFLSTALFTANLVQMSHIGKFMANRILFDE